MFSSTPFQFLPPHVVRLIVHHVVGSSRQVFVGIEPNSNEWNTLLKPLLWTCHTLRTVAYPLYCSRYKFAIANSRNYHRLLKRAKPSSFYIGHRMNNNLGYPTHHLAKTLDIEIDEKGIYSGETLMMLSHAPYNGCAFPLVRKIVFHILVDENLKEDMETKRNIVAFVQRIKQMAPNVNDIWVRPVQHYAPRFSSSPIYNSLVSKLLQLAGRVQYGATNDPLTPVDLELASICKLVHIKCAIESYDPNFIELARQSSTTLESLIIGSHGGIYVPGIIWEGGDYVAYPHLHTLKLSGYTDDRKTLGSIPAGVVPFPSLRCLKIHYEYTFRDDVVFRGNAATLESLSLLLYYSTMSVLYDFGVFTPTSHPKLRYVRLWGLSNFVPDIFATNTEALRFAIGIGPTAPMRNIGLHSTGAELIPTLSHLDGLDSIQFLSLSVKTLELWDVIALIKALPMMSDLTVKSTCLVPLPGGVTMDELPEYVISTYAPMGGRFRCWQLDSFRAESSTVAAKCVLLLALACPSFTFATLPDGKHKEFVVMLEAEIASDMFKPYAPRLQCFIT
ncbi:hypothetical protein H4R27_004231 [Coemansia aciculifera]|nr:hypothetical protein H4R27_004231 [Coemansia aciculifera]